MNQPYLAPRSFHPDAPPSHSSSIPLYQHAVPTQTVLQQRQEQQIQENISPQSHPSAHQFHIHNGIPSDRQRAAVLTLQANPNATIFSYLESFRSFLKRETAFYPNHLSRQQYQAFIALTGCSNEMVLTLLNCARFAGSLASPQKSCDSSTLCNGRVSANCLARSPSFVSNPSIRSTMSSPLEQGSYNLSRADSVRLPNSSVASANEYDRWCFVSDDHTRPFTTMDGFKKHLREHFTGYFCIPPKALVYKEDGPRCASCNIPNPDLIHLNAHVTECVGRKFTRKSTLIKHLEKKHGVHDGSVLASESEYSVDQKYFACGFCVFYCGSLNELANHVDAHHYRFLQHIRDWDYDKVIRGLLFQPVVAECWQAILASNPPLQESWFRWRPTLVKQLKHRLEMSQEPAEALCNAAIDASNYRRNCYGYLESVPLTNLTDQETITDQTIEAFERQDAISPLSFNSEQSHIAYSLHTAAASPQMQHPARHWDGFSYTDWDQGRRYPQIASETYTSPTSATYQHPSHRAHSFYPSNSGESSMQYQGPAYSSSTASASGTSRVLEGQAWASYNSRLGRHSPGLSPNLATNPQSRQELERYTTPAQAHGDWNYPVSTMESASLPLSRDYSISGLSHYNETCNSRAHLPVAAQSSRRESMNRRGIGTDSDSDNQQCFTHARGRSRRQRRDH